MKEIKICISEKTLHGPELLDILKYLQQFYRKNKDNLFSYIQFL